MDRGLSNQVVPEKESRSLRFLYNTFLGRCFLAVLISPWLSKLAGKFLDTPLSKPFIKTFIKKTNIDLNDYEKTEYRCFNDCFSRKIKEGKRPIAEDERVVISPCDANLSVYKISEGSVYPVKQSKYTVASLLKNGELAEEYNNGYIFVFRLCVDHYHRYVYSVSGKKNGNVYIDGKLHTVRPIALYDRPVFCENAREYTVIDSEQFGKVVQMEVGALLVGKINNFHGEKTVEKGEEKGTFLYGGSTIILLFKEGSITPKSEFIENTNKGFETRIKQGEQINDNS